MRFTPKTEAQIQEERDQTLGVWVRGVYDFQIAHAEDKRSSKGNDMIELTVNVYNTDGDHKTIKDYLLESMAHKLRHAAEAFGMLAEYERGALVAERIVGKAGKCRLGIEKDKTGNYPDKNKIEDYEKPRAGIGAHPAVAPSARQPAPAGDIDDDIPF